MAVTVSGAVLSSLCFEHGNSDGDQEGFLLGQVVSHVTDTISDSQLNNVKEETVTYIYNYIPTGSSFTWYTKSGCIVHERLKQLLKGHHKEVVGWYRFRRNSTLRMSLRERAIHMNVKEAFPNVPAHHFLYALFTSSATSRLATHSHDHIFSSFDGRTFHNLSLNVVNLKDTSQMDYKLHSTSSVGPTSGYYSSALDATKPEFKDDRGKLHQVGSIHTLNSCLHQQLMDLCGDVADSEKEIAGLSAELDDLRVRCRHKPPVRVRLPQKQVQEPLLDAPIPGSSNQHSAMDISQPASIVGQTEFKTKPLDIHEDLKMLVDSPADLLLGSNVETDAAASVNHGNPFNQSSDHGDDKGEKGIQKETLSSGNPRPKSTSPVPTSLDLNHITRGSEGIAAPKADHSQSDGEPKSLENKENSKKDAFSFVEDMLSSAKATSPTVAKVSKYNTLPRTGTSKTETHISSSTHEKKKPNSAGNSKSHTLPRSDIRTLDGLSKPRNTRSNAKPAVKSISTSAKARMQVISSDSSDEDEDDDDKEIKLSSSPVY